jgi:hypothetical protein
MNRSYFSDTSRYKVYQIWTSESAFFKTKENMAGSYFRKLRKDFGLGFRNVLHRAGSTHSG